MALQAYLDGQQFGSATPIYTHAPLSPVGPASLGGIGENAITRFQEAYSDAETRYLHYFAGNIADFRLANTAASATIIAAERFAAPAANAADLVAYLPLDEGQGESFTDQTGHGNTGSLVPRNMVLASHDAQNNWDNIYAHYKNPAALTWTNYAYTGRINLRDAKSAGGVTFFSHHLEHLDQFYAFWWSPIDSALHISAHPLGLRPISDWKLANISPAYGTWYHFRIEAIDDGKQTIIKAKVWAKNTAEPADFQITVNDASHLRSKAGTVGICANQGIAVDNLLVQPLSAPSGGPATPLLIEHFEEYVASDPSTTWSQTGTRREIVPNTTAFKITAAPGTDNLLVFGSQGTHSELEDAHTHYTGTGSATWSNYTYQGRLYVSDVNAAPGLTFFSGYPTTDAYYRILCYQEQPTFLLDRHPFDAPPLKGTLDSGVTPTPATWYRFRIEVQQAGSRTTTRARFWKDGTSEPANFQIDAYDDTDQRLRSGTVGAWTVGSGTKLLDRLIVTHVDLLPSWDEKNNAQNGHDDHDTSSYVQLRVHGNSSSSWWTVVQRRDEARINGMTFGKAISQRRVGILCGKRGKLTLRTSLMPISL